MPALPPQLTEKLLDLTTPHVRIDSDRVAQFQPTLTDWSGYSNIEWHGSPRAFMVRLIHQLPAEVLKKALRSMIVGEDRLAEINDICHQIDAWYGVYTATVEDPLRPYYQTLINTLSDTRYQLDSRFVSLTLLIDKGEDNEAGRWQQPHAQQSKYHSLSELLEELNERLLVLLGAPGSGKSTLLRRLQLEMAWEQLKTPTGKVPFFVQLNGYLEETPPFEWLQTQWQTHHPNLLPFHEYFNSGRVLLLCDGLNEMPHQDSKDYRRRIGLWQSFLAQTHSRGNVTLFSCRSLDYSAPLSRPTLPVPQVNVSPLTEEQIQQFLEKYLNQQHELVWEALRQDKAQLALFSNPFFLKLLTDQVDATGTIPAGQVGLLTGFVRRALRREIERNHPLFEPDLVLSDDDRLQLLNNAWASPHALPDEGVLIPALENLAYQMQANPDNVRGGHVRILENEARTLLDHSMAKQTIAAGLQLHLLDKDLTQRTLTYYHQLIQEYFAARRLAQNGELAWVETAWKRDDVSPSLEETLASLNKGDALGPLDATGWEETTVLAAAMVANPDWFVQRLMPLNLPVAARCALTPEVRVSEAVKAELQTQLVQRIEDAQADLRTRMAAAEQLGYLGDIRFSQHSGPHGDYRLPPFVEIEGGQYPIGSDESSYEDERPKHQVGIAPFEMGVYPVTNAEYELFMAAGGYEDEQWWQTEAAKAWLSGTGGTEGQKQGTRELYQLLQQFTEEQIKDQNASEDQINSWLYLKGLDLEALEKQLNQWYPDGEVYREPRFWQDSRYNNPSQPVVGISWFEALAYCAWLSAQTGQEIALPTEVEWEAAAGGKEGRQYPYGSEYDVTKGNTFETHIRSTTPVGLFPEGKTPSGLYDLSGNVWEWTTTIWGASYNEPDFTYPYSATNGREDLQNGTARRVVRGGSWSSHQFNARTASRRGDDPAARYNYSGFRLVVRPPS